MNEPATNLRDTIVPKSDQLNADELLAGAITITITNVSRSSSPDQPISVNYQGDNGKPYKPCKTMRKLMIHAWSDDGRNWVGKRATLYNDPSVKFGGVSVGGIRISHMSGINNDLSVSLTETKGKKRQVLVKKLVDNAVPTVDEWANYLTGESSKGMQALRDAWMQVPKNLQAGLKPVLDSLKPTAEAADNANHPLGFNPANEPPAPVQQPAAPEQPQQPEEQF